MGQASGALLGRERVWEADGEREAPTVAPVPILPSPGCQMMEAKAFLTFASIHSRVHSLQAFTGHLGASNSVLGAQV